MSLVGKALWCIESHLGTELTLDELALACGASRFHLARSFGLATGYSPIRYLRARRMTEAARVLAAGAQDILAVALDAGYGSHEAFTRAFREHFGVTPERVRADGNCDGLALVPPIRLDEETESPPRKGIVVDIPDLCVTGIRERYTADNVAGIPAQWGRLNALGPFPGAIANAWFGVCSQTGQPGEWDYTCGLEISGDRPPAGLVQCRIPGGRYAVFLHEGHVSTIRTSWQSIHDSGLPALGLHATGGPEFERYDERFDPSSGNGIIEIWIPVTSTRS